MTRPIRGIRAEFHRPRARTCFSFGPREHQNNAAFHALTGFTGLLRCDPIFSTRLVEMSSDAIPFSPSTTRPKESQKLEILGGLKSFRIAWESESLRNSERSSRPAS
jgi:hypothetical protein